MRFCVCAAHRLLVCVCVCVNAVIYYIRYCSELNTQFRSCARVRPNEPSGFRGRKAKLNHASALVTLSITSSSSSSFKYTHTFIYLFLFFFSSSFFLGGGGGGGGLSVLQAESCLCYKQKALRASSGT